MLQLTHKLDGTKEMDGSLCLYYYLVMQMKQQLSDRKTLTERHTYLKSRHISKNWIFLGWWKWSNHFVLPFAVEVLCSKILVGQVIVCLRYFSNGQTSPALLLLKLYFQNLESVKHFTKFRSFLQS